MKKVYVCEFCGKAYSARMDARWCEIIHENLSGGFRQQLSQILRQHLNPCDYCLRNCGENCSPDCNDWKSFLPNDFDFSKIM